MRRWCIGLFIAAYLTTLTGGIVCQALRVGMTAHPAAYFIMWDMYCGWAAYNSKYRAIAEGVSGAYYDLDPAPWGTFRPFNTQGRFQYSTSTVWMAKAAAHTVKRTEHEPIARIFVVEQSWAKQFDLPDYIWKTRYNVAKQPYRYSSIRVEMDGSGNVVKTYPNWVEVQTQLMIADNERIQKQIRDSRPFWMVDEYKSNGNRYFQQEEQNTLTTVTKLSAPVAQ
jgi:hypothetical protein